MLRRQWWMILGLLAALLSGAAFPARAAAPSPTVSPSPLAEASPPAPAGVWVINAQTVRWVTDVTTPAEAIRAAGQRVSPKTLFWVNGQPWEADQPLPAAAPLVVQWRTPTTVTLQVAQAPVMFESDAPTWAAALWGEGLILHAADVLDVALSASPSDHPQAELRLARPVTAQIVDRKVHLYTAADTVGEALAQGNLAPQGLDTTSPADTAAVPAQKPVALHWVHEAIVLRQVPVAFETKTQPLPDQPLDTIKVVQEGAYGLQVQRVRVRYVDGQEVDRTIEAAWLAKEPQPRIVGYGTKIVERTLDTPNGPITYWRAIKVYATSYSPCRLGVDYCSQWTASGARLHKGIVAVTLAWYRYMAGQKVYIPGYGFAVIADTGGGIPGKPWVDLGFSDDDYEPWHQWVTMYFLAPPPPPEKIPWILP